MTTFANVLPYFASTGASGITEEYADQSILDAMSSSIYGPGTIFWQVIK
jgi:hypothetical protein